MGTMGPTVTPKVVRTIAALRQEMGEWRRQGLTSAVVPTMGSLHEGHLALVAEGRKRAERVVVTIFVNPRQFGANEDLTRYPRNEEGDLAKLAEAGVDLVFAPRTGEIYPEGFTTTITLGGPAKAGLEDKFRPHFFDGVATVVAKLFIETGSDFAIFGEKDYQQLLTVKRMAKDLDLPITVVAVPTVREESGLALSSRNQYLSRSERNQASAIYRVLVAAAEKIRAGERPSRVTAAARRSLTTLGFRIDYVAFRHAETLAPLESPQEPARMLAAAWLGTTRLIDNVPV
jgi:pantoate--beta-alanine ligase